MSGPTRSTPGRSDADRGAASVLALGIVGAIVALTALVVPTASVFVLSQRAANAADAAALAAADAISGAVAGTPCPLARETAARNGAVLASCETGGPVASVTVTVATLGLEIRAAARAGPLGWTG
jgi:secretion/DNA translocation related TadE-like protein